MKDRSRGRARFITLVLLLSIALPGALALPGCGGSDGGGATETTASPSPAVTSTPTAGASEADVIAAYAAMLPRLEEPGVIDDLMSLYTDDARMEDRAYGATSVGRAQIRSYWAQWFTSGVLSDKVVSTHIGSGCAVVESLASSPGVVSLPAAEIIKLDGGRIATHYVYYYDGRIRRAPAPVGSPPAPTDTEAVSERVAGRYLAALRALDAGGLRALYSRDVVYRDTADRRSFAGPAVAARAHAKMFALKGLEFTGAGILTGPGWAAVMWRRTDREGHQIPYPDLTEEYLQLAKRPTIAGVTVLEIRDGEIARETIYCDHLRTRL